MFWIVSVMYNKSTSLLPPGDFFSVIVMCVSVVCVSICAHFNYNTCSLSWEVFTQRQVRMLIFQITVPRFRVKSSSCKSHYNTSPRVEEILKKLNTDLNRLM